MPSNNNFVTGSATTPRVNIGNNSRGHSDRELAIDVLGMLLYLCMSKAWKESKITALNSIVVD